MTRCAEFYQKCEREGSDWCEKTPRSVEFINNYLELLRELEYRGIPKKRTIVRLPEGLVRPIFEKRNSDIRSEIIDQIAEALGNGSNIKGEVKRKRGKLVSEIIHKIRAKQGATTVTNQSYIFNVENVKFYAHSSENMDELPNENIHMVITSPPYNNKVDYDVYIDKKPHEEYYALLRTVLQECYRKLVLGGRVALVLPNITGKRFAITYIPQLLEQCGFFFREFIVWQKHRTESHGNEHGTAWGSWCSPSNPSLRSVCEFIFIGHKHSPFLKSETAADITSQEFLNWTTDIWLVNPSTHGLHPAVFPVELVERLIKLYTFPSMTVLDPFCGVGTAAKACRKLGRKFVGYDVSRNYIAIAERELRES